MSNTKSDIPDGKRKRVLYHVGHPGFMPKMLLHKMEYHKDDDAFFIFEKASSSPQTSEFMSGWGEKNSDIGRLLIYSDSTFWHDSDISSLEAEIVSFFDRLF